MKIGFCLLPLLLGLSACSPDAPRAPLPDVFILPNGEKIFLGAKQQKKSEPSLKTSADAPTESAGASVPATPGLKTENPVKTEPKANLSMRMPDMLTMPEDSQLRSAPSTKPANKTGIIARPPAE